MSIDTTRTAIFRARPDQAFEAVCATARAARMPILAADAAHGQVRFKPAVSVWSWGEILTAQVQPSGPDDVAVTITSAITFGFLSPGRSERNLDMVFAHLAAQLPPGSAPQ